MRGVASILKASEEAEAGEGEGDGEDGVETEGTCPLERVKKEKVPNLGEGSHALADDETFVSGNACADEERCITPREAPTDDDDDECDAEASGGCAPIMDSC